MDILDTSLSSSPPPSFEQCEAIIQRGLQSFVEVGKALLRIKEEKYYQQEYNTFADYCRERWCLGASRVYQLINATYVMDNLSSHLLPSVEISEPEVQPLTSIFPQTEAQVRPLTKLEPEQQIEAWKMSIERAEADYPTAKEISLVVDELYPSPPKSDDPSPKSESLVLEDAVRARFQCPECQYPVFVEAKDLRLTLYCQVHEQELALHGALDE